MCSTHTVTREDVRKRIPGCALHRQGDQVEASKPVNLGGALIRYQEKVGEKTTTLK
jgi:hypothetical protein